MPRIRRAASCPRPARSSRCDFPSEACGSIPASRPAREVSPFYDPMIAKLIAHGPSRDAALDQLADALERTIVAGPRSNVAFLAALCRAPDFRAGKFDTGFIDRHLARSPAVPSPTTPPPPSAPRGFVAQDTRPDCCGRRPGRRCSGSPWDAPTVSSSPAARRDAPDAGRRRAVEADVVDTAGRHGRRGRRRGRGDGRAIEADAIYVLRHGRQTVVRRASPAPAISIMATAAG